MPCRYEGWQLSCSGVPFVWGRPRRSSAPLGPAPTQANAHLPPLHTHRNPRPTPPLNVCFQIRMILNHLKKIPHLTPVRKNIVRKNRTPTQVNAEGYFHKFMPARPQAGGGGIGSAERRAFTVGQCYFGD